MRTRALGAALVLVAGALSACGTPGMEGDCSAKAVLDDRVYRPADGFQVPRRGPALGPVGYVGCEDEPAPGLGEDAAYAVDGESPTEVLLVAAEGHDVLYLARSVPWRDRPRLVREADRFLACTGRAEFSAAWQYVDPEDQPGEDDVPQPPYTVVLETRSGTGVGLDRWALTTLEVEVTEETAPAPDRELFRPTSTDPLVEVAATCRGGAYVATSLQRAG